MSTSTLAASTSSFRVALVQLGNVGTDKKVNLEQARLKIAEAAKGNGRKVDVVVLPEVFNSPYAAVSFPEYAEEVGFTKGQKYDMATSTAESIKMLSAAAVENNVWLVGGSIPELLPNPAGEPKIYNSSPTFTPTGELVAFHRKVHLFDINIPGGVSFTESETLTGGDEVTIVETDFGKIGIAICYDVRFPELAMIAARRGCVAMIYPGAFNTSTGPLHWDLLMRARAVDNQMFVMMCSPARATTGEGYKAYGFSGVSDPMGKILGQLGEDEGILYVDIDLEVLKMARAGIPVTRQRRFDVYSDVSAE